jgi:hypothetical protein
MTKILNEQPKQSTPKPKAKRLSEVVAAKTDLPEYVKSEELTHIRPFTIFGARLDPKGRFGPRYKFDVAWRHEGGTVKKVLTLSANEERENLAYQVQKHGAIINCRLIQINLGGGQTYWKIIDNDDPIPDDVPITTQQMSLEEIPF